MPVALSNTPPASGAPTSVTPAAGATASPVDFLLVLAQQISVEPLKPQNVLTAAPSPGAVALPASLAELLTQEMPQTPAEETDSDSDTDDTADEGSGALALAALLPGLPSLAAPAPRSSASTPLEGLASAIGEAQDSSQDAASLAAANAFVEASAEQSTAEGESSTVPNSTSAQAAHAAQAHAGLTHQLAASTDAANMARDLRAPVGTPAWSDELGGQLTWMAANGRESASLRLSPENLGPLEIRISVQEGEARVWFGAANAETRSALEQSLPRLRELFASQGLVLADAGVYRDAPRDRASANSFASHPGSPEADGEANVTSVTKAHAGLIDTYV